jgi:hypothetical protein
MPWRTSIARQTACGWRNRTELLRLIAYHPQVSGTNVRYERMTWLNFDRKLRICGPARPQMYQYNCWRSGLIGGLALITTKTEGFCLTSPRMKRVAIAGMRCVFP